MFMHFAIKPLIDLMPIEYILLCCMKFFSYYSVIRAKFLLLERLL